MPDSTIEVRLEAHGDGVTIDVLAAPRASKDRIVGVHDGALKIATTAPPVDGEANEALRRYLSAILGVSRGSVTLAQGQSSRRKRFHVAGLTDARARELIRTELATLGGR